MKEELIQAMLWVDIGILIVLSFDVWISYQNMKLLQAAAGRY